MVMWVYVPERRLKAAEMRSIPKDKTCFACNGSLARMAERGKSFPYPWVPNGWICTSCNLCYMGVA